MLLTDARRSCAHTMPTAASCPLAEQDRELWNASVHRRGRRLVTDALSRTPLGPYQLQAAIAAVHDEAARAEDTDWPQILALLRAARTHLTEPDGHAQPRRRGRHGAGPTGRPRPSWRLDQDRRVAGHHRLDAVRAHLLEMAGERSAALASYRSAARRTTSLPNDAYLEGRAARPRRAASVTT